MSVILVFNHFVMGMAMAHIREGADTGAGANQNQETAERHFMGQDCPDDA